MKKYWLLYLIGFIFLVSCEKFIEIDLPDFEPQFVINGTLEPGSPIHIYVTKSKGPLESLNYVQIVDGVWGIEQFEVIKDAKVEIIVDGQNSYPLYFEEYFESDGIIDLGRYTSEDLEIEVGKEYELIVSGQNLATARSKVKIPEPVVINLITVERGDPIDFHHFPKVDFTINFTDPGENNYYEVKVYLESIFTSVNHFGDTVKHVNGEYGHPELKNTIYGQNRGWGSGPQSLLNNSLFNGKEISLDFSSFPPSYYVDNFNVRVFLRNISEDWYKHESTAHLQRSTRQDPLSQPVQVHSNIQGGLGILKAGTPTHDEVNVKWELN